MKNTIKFIFIILTGISFVFGATESSGTDAVSSATSPALKKTIPEKFSIRIAGKVKREYALSSEYLSTLSSVRIRTKEITPDGKVMGAYFYQ